MLSLSLEQRGTSLESLQQNLPPRLAERKPDTANTQKRNANTYEPSDDNMKTLVYDYNDQYGPLQSFGNSPRLALPEELKLPAEDHTAETPVFNTVMTHHKNKQR